jgi:hypothetical protein
MTWIWKLCWEVAIVNLYVLSVIGIYFLIVVKSFHKDMKEKQTNNTDPV